MNITKQHLNTVFCNKYNYTDIFISELNCALAKIKNKAMFLAQFGHESCGFTVRSENLNYSVDGLLKVFPKYFKTREIAQLYARHPEKIANRVYANRMGNGDEASGDGWKYRGRAVCQLTGKDNYVSYFLHQQNQVDGGNFIENPDLLLEDKYFIDAGVFYWISNNLDAFNTVEGARKKVNGGLIGIEPCINLYNGFIKILG